MSAPFVVNQFPQEKEYAKETGVSPDDLAKLRAWLATQPHLPGDITDLTLVLAYHCCQCSAEVSKQVLDLHFTLKTLFENLFKDLFVTQEILTMLTTVVMLPLRARAHDGSAVLYIRVIDPDPKKFIYNVCIRAVMMTIELWQEEEGTWPGLQIVFDMKMFSLQHLAKIDLLTLQQFVYFLQEAMLVKVTGLHFINASSFIDKMMMLIKPLMKKSLLDCLFIHLAGATTLEKHVPMDGLPEEAGGKYISVMQASADLRERFKLNAEFFERENRRRVEESRRPGKPKTISDIVGGIDGSFKKLDID